ncbi:hypothetical protein J6590_062765 [Homalodisca vitripennis]|nr:hypothetical protein J6590_062765 [Homalodisca vitripennis]
MSVWQLPAPCQQEGCVYCRTEDSRQGLCAPAHLAATIDSHLRLSQVTHTVATIPPRRYDRLAPETEPSDSYSLYNVRCLFGNCPHHASRKVVCTAAQRIATRACVHQPTSPLRLTRT